MLPVYICEDDGTQLEELRKFIEKNIMIENLDMQIVCAEQSPHHILSHLSKHPTPSLYFLDVELHSDINGFQLAEAIRQLDPRGFLVFITTHSECSQMVFEYKTEAMDYVIKDDIAKRNDKISSCLQKAQELSTLPTNKLQKKITFKIGGSLKSIDMNTIYGIETTVDNPHHLTIFEKTAHSVISGSLTTIATQLDHRFFQCHKSCIVNLDQIGEIDIKNHIVYLLNKKSFPVSTRYMTSLLKRYKEHIFTAL